METKIIKLGSVNSYLLTAGAGFILVDTGPADKRANLERELENAGCRPGNLNLIVATHGDSDHVGNCVWLRQKYAAKITMHRAEAEAVATGDPALNKKIPPNLMGALTRSVLRFFRLNPADRFTPEVWLEDGDDLSGYGLTARVLHIPGHSNGSVGVLLPSGELFCGDLLINFLQPAPGLGIVDRVEFEATLEKLRRVNIQTVYPGHGKPFAWESFVKNYFRRSTTPKRINATRLTVSTFGVLAGLIGIPYGLFEILRGNVATGGFLIDAIGPANKLWHGGPASALTLIPNFLVTGIAAIIASLLVILWATVFVGRKHGALVLFLLSLAQLFMGGGVAQMMLVILISALATQIHAPLSWWRAHLSVKVQGFLAKLWPWFLVTSAVLYFLHYAVPFIIGLTGSFLGISDPNLGLVIGYTAIGPFVGAILTGFAHDSLDDCG